MDCVEKHNQQESKVLHDDYRIRQIFQRFYTECNSQQVFEVARLKAFEVEIIFLPHTTL